jgi:hypothetical protein
VNIDCYGHHRSWTLKCRSHYVIDRGKVIEAGPWSDEQVETERRRDRTAKARFYGESPKVERKRLANPAYQAAIARAKPAP